MSKPEQHQVGIHDQFGRVTTIQYELGDEQLFGTGFYFQVEDQYFLITNRHIVRHEYDMSPDTLRIRYRDEDDMTNIKPHTIQLFESIGDSEKQARWYEHPNESKPDVAVVPIGLDLEPTGSKAYTRDDYLSNDINLKGGDAATVIGYPYEVLDHQHYFPVMRYAVIASPYLTGFNDEPCFVIDSTQQPGSSGSPVITSPSNWYLKHNGDRIHGDASLLGIHSGSVVAEENVGLYQVWHAELIDIILQESYQPTYEIHCR